MKNRIRNDLHGDTSSIEQFAARSVEELVQRIISYKNQANGRLYESINQTFLLSLMDKLRIIDIENSFPQRGLDIIDFVRLMLKNIPHREDETIFVVMALIDMFKQISEAHNLATHVQMRHITSLICEQMQEKNNVQYKIQTVQIPEPQKFKIDPSKIRSIDIDPPPLYGRYDEDLKRLVKQKIKTDSMHHLNHRIKNGVYAKDMKRIISLDSLADKITMYSLDCELKYTIKPKSSNMIGRNSSGADNSEQQQQNSSDVIIFSIAWSERQQRLGATMKDFTMSFWDRSDDFKYEKQISVQGLASDYQSAIWYLEFPNCWLTTDSKNQLYEWDLEKECIKRTLFSPKIKHTIFEVVEIPQLKLIAVGSSDRLVTIWNFESATLVQCIEFKKSGIHSLKFFESYQVLICGGFQNLISIHSINPEYLDVNPLGDLIGHQSMITAIDCIEKTPMVISSDDSGVIKIWDIRTMKCVQTLDCGQRTVITRILNIYLQGKLCFLGTRINIIDFDEAEIITKKKISYDEAFPIKVETTPNQLIVVTRKDIRFVDVNTGKIKQIFIGLLSDGEDEITAFKQIEQGSKFILGNHRGEITLHGMWNGELISKLNCHSNEITNLRIDYENKLLVTGGWDSNIKIQHLSDGDSEVKREITNCFFNKEVTLIELSVYHNLIFAASNSETIYVFDYEFAKLISAISLEAKVEVQAMQVVNGFSMLFLSTNNGFIHILHFQKKEHAFSARLIGSIDILHLINSHANENPISCFITQPKQHAPTDSSLPLISNILPNPPKPTGAKKADPKELVQKNSLNSSTPKLSTTQQSKTQTSTFQQSIFAQKNNTDNASQPVLEISRTNSQEESNNNAANNESEDSHQKQIFANKILVECGLGEDPGNADQIVKLNLFCSLNKGSIFGLNLLKFTQQFNNLIYTEHCNRRVNYNAFRANTENFIKSVQQIKSETLQINSTSKLSSEGRSCSDTQLHKTLYEQIIFMKNNAHRDTVTALKLITFKECYLMTSSMDCYVKTWDKHTGELKASLNINHPLPTIWNITKDVMLDGKKRIVFALKILDVISKKYSKELSFQELRQLRVTDFIAQLALWSEDSMNEQLAIQKELNISKKDEDKILLMRDEYSPRDLKYENTKAIFQNELRGPTLKRMEANKRVALATKVWKQEAASKEIELENRMLEENIMLKNYKFEEQEEVAFFLDQKYREKLVGNDFARLSEEFTKGTQDLSKKIDTSLLPKRPKKMSSVLAQAGQNISTVLLKKSLSKVGDDLKKLPDEPKKIQRNGSVARSKNNVYQYAEKMQYIDDRGIAVDLNQVLYPLIKTKPKLLPTPQIQWQNSSTLSQPSVHASIMNASSVQHTNNNNVSSYFLPGDSLLQELQNDQTHIINQSQNQINNISVINKNQENQQNFTDNVLNNGHIRRTTPLVGNKDMEMVKNNFNHNKNNSQTNISLHNNSIVSNNNNNNTNSTTIDDMSRNNADDSRNESQNKHQGYYFAPKISHPLKNNKLQQLIKSMDLKVKKSQQSFTNDSFTTEFLQKRALLNANPEVTAIMAQIKEKKQYNMPETTTSVTTMKIEFTSGIGEDKLDPISCKSSTKNICFGNNDTKDGIRMKSQSQQEDGKVDNIDYSGKQQQNKQKNNTNSTLSQVGLETLKKVLYSQGQDYKCRSALRGKHYLGQESRITSTKQDTSQQYGNNSSFFTYNSNGPKIMYEDGDSQKNRKQRNIPQFKDNSNNNEDEVLVNLHKSVFDNPQDVQKRILLKKQLNFHLNNAHNIQQHIDDANEPSPDEKPQPQYKQKLPNILVGKD